MALPASAVPLLSLSGVTKRYGFVTALQDISLSVFGGEFVAIFGPNGAGKSTLLRVISGLMQPTRGSVKMAGVAANRARLGYVSHQSMLYNEMTGLENLVFFAQLHGVENPRQEASRLLDRMGLTTAGRQLVQGYSRGMKQRLTLARALLHRPGMLLLDEPYAGLDQQGKDLLTTTLRSLHRKGKTILLVTHNLADGLDLCTRVVIQHRGQLVYEGTRAAVQATGLQALYNQLVDSGKAAGPGAGRQA